MPARTEEGRLTRRLLVRPPSAGCDCRSWPIRRAALHVSVSVLCIAALANPIFAAADDDHPDVSAAQRNGMWFPANDFYPRYIADPLRPQNALTIQWLPETEVPDTTAGRFGLRLGGAFGIYRWAEKGSPDLGWQLTFEGGFAGQFDLGYSWDNTGWDGFYGLYLAWKPRPRLGFRIGMQHNSTHVGDEYFNRDRNNNAPIHYTREEAVLGVAYRLSPRWTVYSELGYGNGHVATVTLRGQAGIQYIGETKHWKNRASFYCAGDVRTYEESDWRYRATVQTGFMIPVGIRSAIHRFAIEAGSGRTVMGQFNQFDESWIGIGWFYDF